MRCVFGRYDTGDDDLVYSDESPFWGTGKGNRGHDLIGKQLMYLYIRSQLRERANAQDRRANAHGNDVCIRWRYLSTLQK